MVTQTKQETRDSKPQENIKKFKEVLLYVLESIGARPNIGESVICKLIQKKIAIDLLITGLNLLSRTN